MKTIHGFFQKRSLLILCLLCVFLQLAAGLFPAARAEVIIDKKRTSKVILEDEPQRGDLTQPRKVTVSADVIIDATKQNNDTRGITSFLSDWDITVNSGVKVSIKTGKKDYLLPTAFDFVNAPELNIKLTNMGTIEGDFRAIRSSYGNIVNCGTMKATKGIGIHLRGQTYDYQSSIINSGEIYGNEAAIRMLVPLGYIENKGIISASKIAVEVDNVSNNTLDNSGTITGTGGTAVTMGHWADTVIVRRGSVFNGIVDGRDGTDRLKFYDAGTQAGSPYKNFEKIDFLSGTTTLTGDGDFSGGDTTVSGAGTVMNLDTGASLKTKTLWIDNNGVVDIAGKATVSNYTMVDKGGSLNINTGGDLTTNILQVSAGTAVIDGTAKVNTSATVFGSLNVNKDGTLETGTLWIARGGTANIAGKTTVSNNTQVDKGSSLNINTGGDLTTDKLQVSNGGTAVIDGTVKVEGATVLGSLNVNKDGTLNSKHFEISDGGTVNIAGTADAGDILVLKNSNLNVETGGDITAASLQIYETSKAAIDGRAKMNLMAFSLGSLNINREGLLDSYYFRIDGGTTVIDGTAKIVYDTLVNGGTLNVNPTGTLNTGTLQVAGVANIAGKSTVNNYTLVDKGGSLNVNQGGELSTGSMLVKETGVANIDGTAKVNKTTTVLGILNVNKDGTLETGTMGVGEGGTANIAGKTTVSDLTLVDKNGSLNINTGGGLMTDKLRINAGGHVVSAGDLIVSSEVYNEGSIFSPTDKRTGTKIIKYPFGTDILLQIPLPSYALEVSGATGKVTNFGEITGYSGILFGDGNNVLDNYGTITATGSGGKAADMGAGDDTVIVRRGKVFNGILDGGSGWDTIVFKDLIGYEKVQRENFEKTILFQYGIIPLRSMASSHMDSYGHVGHLKADGDFNGSLVVIPYDSQIFLDSGFTIYTGDLLVEAGGEYNSDGTTKVKLYKDVPHYVNSEGSTTVLGILNVNKGGALETVTMGVGDGGVSNIAGKTTVGDLTLVDKNGSLNINTGGDLTTDKLQVSNAGTAVVDGTAKVNKDTAVLGILNVNKDGTLDTGTLGVGDGGVSNIAGKTTVSDLTQVDKGGSLNINTGGDLTTDKLRILSGGTAKADGNLIVATEAYNEGAITGTTKGGYALQVTGNGTATNLGTISGDTVIVRKGKVFNGILDGGSGWDTLVFNDLIGYGKIQHRNFEKITLFQNGITPLRSMASSHMDSYGSVYHLSEDGDFRGALFVIPNDVQAFLDGGFTLYTGDLLVEAGAEYNSDGTTKVKIYKDVPGYVNSEGSTTVLGSLNVNKDGTLETVTFGIGEGGTANIAGKTAVSNLTQVDKGGSLNIDAGGDLTTDKLRILSGGTAKADGNLIVATEAYNEGAITGTTKGGYALQVTGNGTATNLGTISGDTAILFGDGANILDNYGTITATGNGGKAADMGAGDDTVIVRSGSLFNGNVDGGAGSNTISFEDNGWIRNGTALNFEKIVTNAGSGGGGVEGDLKSGKEFYLNGPGVFTVGGKYTQEKDSLLYVKFTDGDSGRITARTAQLDGGIVITLGYIREGKHVLIETTEKDGLTGKFDELRLGEETRLGQYLKMKYDLDYNGDSTFISTGVVRSMLFIADALTRNEKAVSGYLDSIYNSASGDLATVFGELLKSADAAAGRSAFNQMGGASHTAFAVVGQARQAQFFRTLLGRDSSMPILEPSLAGQDRNPFIRLAMNGEKASDAMFSTPEKDKGKRPWDLWIKSYGVFGDRSGEDIASRYNYTIGGLVAGLDRFFAPNLRAGVAFGYSKTTMNMKDLRDDGSEDSFQGALYGAYDSGRWYLDAALSYAYNRYETTRPIIFGGISRSARGSYNGSDLSGYAETGYRFDAGNYKIAPLASFLALRSSRDAFTETGADSLNLSAESAETTSLQGALGARVSRKFMVSEKVSLTPELSARWIHEFGDREAMLNARFAGAPAGSFTVYSDEVKGDCAALSLGMKAAVGDAWSIFVAYDGQFKSDQTSHAATGGVQFQW